MSQPRCPGQDQRYWKPDDIFNVTCPFCAAQIETRIDRGYVNNLSEAFISQIIGKCDILRASDYDRNNMRFYKC